MSQENTLSEGFNETGVGKWLKTQIFYKYVNVSESSGDITMDDVADDLKWP